MCQRHFKQRGRMRQRHVVEDVGAYIGKMSAFPPNYKDLSSIL